MSAAGDKGIGEDFSDMDQSLEPDMDDTLDSYNRRGSYGPERLSNSFTDSSKKLDKMFTVDEAVNQMGFGPFQVLVTVFCGLLWVADAIELMLLSILSPIVNCQWDLSRAEEAAITSIVFAGIMLGSVFWGFMNDLIGRKKSLLAVDLLILLFGVLSALQVSADDSRLPGYPWLLICRFGVGFCTAGTPQTITYYAEFLPQKRRGVWLVAIAVWWTVGSMFCAALAILILGTLHLSWHWFLGLAATPLAMVLVLFPLVPESARFYLVKGKEDKARKVIERVAKLNCKKPPTGQLVLQEVKDKENARKAVVKYKKKAVLVFDEDFVIIPDGKEDLEEGTAEEAVASEVINKDVKASSEEVSGSSEESWLLKESHDEEPQGKTKIQSIWKAFINLMSPLFVKGMWKTTVLLLFICFGSSWLYYGAVVLTTTLLRFDPHCGSLGVNETNVTECAELGTQEYVEVLWASAAELPGLVFTFIIVDIIGRKKSMALEFLFAAGAFCLLFICASNIILTVFLFIIRAFVTGVIELAYIYTPEVYPTQSRALGLGVCNTAGRLGGIVTPIIAQVVFDANDYVTISLYAGSALVLAVLAMLLPIETKGRALHDKVD